MIMNLIVKRKNCKVHRNPRICKANENINKFPYGYEYSLMINDQVLCQIGLFRFFAVVAVVSVVVNLFLFAMKVTIFLFYSRFVNFVANNWNFEIVFSYFLGSYQSKFLLFVFNFFPFFDENLVNLNFRSLREDVMTSVGFLTSC